MPGGEAAIRAPWRMAVSYLMTHFGEAALDRLPEPLRELAPPNLDAVAHMAELRASSPLTSSCGCLFDAVASLLGVCHRVTYDGQAAVELESLIDRTEQYGAYEFEILPGVDEPDTPADGAAPAWQIGSRAVFETLLADLANGVSPGAISQRFHNGLIECLSEVSTRIRVETSLERVCLSGGSFHNAYLLEHLIKRLEREHFDVYSHSALPTGDGGLCLGQALVAAHT
jgi:hydrogenase maturation protein HypF